MAPEVASRPRAPFTPVLGWAGATLIGVLVIAALIWRFGSQVPAAPDGSATFGVSTEALTAIPLPEGFAGAVVVPADYGDMLAVGADAAVERARGNSPSYVGADPLIRLMHVTKSGPDTTEWLDGIYWVILSPDADPWISSPYGMDTSDDEYTSYGWVLVDVKGEIALVMANSYLEGHATPPDLPDS